MDRRMLRLAAGLGAVILSAACAQNPESPMSPSASADGSTAANPDGSTLKVSAPVAVSPANGARTENVQPTVVFRNSVGRFTSVTLAYRLQLFNAAGQVIAEIVVGQDPSGQTSVSAQSELAWDTEYRWRVRAELEGSFGPWSDVTSFRTPVPAITTRAIQVGEAIDIIINIHNVLRVDLGTGDSGHRYRQEFFGAAVAAIHYGHPRFNPRGPDPSWCIKDAGGGRPVSDETLVLCRSREAWDVIGGNGGRGYFFKQDYLGVLPPIQNVYPPAQSQLNWLNR